MGAHRVGSSLVLFGALFATLVLAGVGVEEGAVGGTGTSHTVESRGTVTSTAHGWPCHGVSWASSTTPVLLGACGW
jgi:hypothetical protein